MMYIFQLLYAMFPPKSASGLAKMFLTVGAERVSVWEIEKVRDFFHISQQPVQGMM